MNKSNLDKVSYISFETDDFDKFMSDDVEMEGWICDGEFISIKIGNKEFNAFVSHEEYEQTFKEHRGLSNSQCETVIVIKALNKLVNFLELGLDVGFSTKLIGK